MEEDRETRTDEDVEAHRVKTNVDRTKLANDEDEGDDVEAHLLNQKVKPKFKA
jgi:hypothetical protein